MTSTNEYLRIGEAARALGVSVDTIRRWTSEGRLPCTRTLGGQRLYRRADIDAARSRT